MAPTPTHPLHASSPSAPSWRAAAVVTALGLASCLSPDEPRTSSWPPPDYYLEVRYQRDHKDVQRVRIWADGLVVYSIADRGITAPEDENAWLPVFATLSAYRLLPLSIRHLSRLLEEAGLYDAEQPAGDASDAAEEIVTLYWVGWENDRTLFARPGAQGEIIRALHVINAFLPPQHPVRLQEMPGDPEPSHVSRAPEPHASLEGALRFHRALIVEHAADRNLHIDTFALAVEAGRKDLAEEILGRLAEIPTAQREPTPPTAPGEAPFDLLAYLRGFLPVER